MMYRTREGDYVSGDSAADVVAELHRQSWSPAPNDYEWMNKCAARVFLQTGKRVSVRSAKKFIEGLVEAGLLFVEQVY